MKFDSSKIPYSSNYIFFDNKNKVVKANTNEDETKNINKYLEKIMPLENIIKEARLVENVHNLIKNNNKNFEINEVELEAANVLA